MTRRLPLLAGALAAALVLTACGSDAGGAAASARPAQTKVVVRAGDTAPFSLLGGHYRLSWVAEGCTAVTFELKQQDGSFEFRKEATMPRFSTILTSVPAGTFALSQVEASCPTWTATIERVGGS